MQLQDLIDLETQLHRDEQVVADAGAAAITSRDRAIGHRVAAELDLEENSAAQRLARIRRLRHAVCARWLSHLPAATRADLPGARIESGYRLVGWILFAVFAILGIGTAGTALASRGDQPVNVLVFIVVFFVVQMLLLVLYPVFTLLRGLRGGAVLPWLQGLVVRMSRARWLDRLTGKHIEDLPATLDRLRTHQSIYGRVQKWLLFALVQRMATGFNAAALLASLYMVTFHDLAFCWSTTLDIAPADLTRWLGWIATPWSWIDGMDIPTVTAIEVSRWVPAESGYVHGHKSIADPELAQLRRSWWPFLITGLVTWGLLPRLLAFTVGSWFAARAARRVPLNHMAVQHLFERMFPPSTSWAGPDPDAVRGTAPIPAGVRARPLRNDDPRPCFVVCWGTLFQHAQSVGTHVERRFQRPVKKVLGAGLADIATDAKTLAKLATAKAGRVVLALPEGQQPTKDLMRMLTDLRARLGAELEIVVGLLAESNGGFEDVDGAEQVAWRTRLSAEADPYLTLQTMTLQATHPRDDPATGQRS